MFLDLVLHFDARSILASPYSTRSGSFCRGLELFCSSVEANFFGLVVMPRIVEGAVRAAVTLSSIVGWGCFFAAVNGVGLFLSSSSERGGAVLQHQKWGGAVLQWFQRWNSNNFVSSHSSVMPHIRCIYWRLGGERRDGV